MNASAPVTALACLVALYGCGKAPSPPAADAVLYNGAVYTMNDALPRASAVAIRDGAIVYVGDDETAQTFIGPDTHRVDLRNRMLLPGFHDTHAHVLAGGSSLTGCNMNDVRDGERIREMLHECLEKFQYGDDEWVIGSRWALAAFADGNPRKEWLDEVFGDRPAYFVDSFAHSAWVSSRALEIAGIDETTPDPAQGVIERDPQTGEATGTLRDAAMELVASHIPEDDDEAVLAGIQRGLQEVSKFGITAYIEPGIDGRYARLYADMDRRGILTARVLGSLSSLAWHAGQMQGGLDDLLEQRAGWRGRMFRADSVKVYIDGVIETRTSNMLAPYSDGTNFPTFYTGVALKTLYEKLHREGVQIHTHAIGDGAIRLALDAYEHARDKVGPLDNRHHIVHLQLIDQADIPRFGELGVAASFQGAWAYPDEYIDIAVDLVGNERVQAFYPVASVQRAGGMLVGGSDWDVSSLNPLDAIETLVRRRDPDALSGPELGDNEQIELDTALRAYTVNAAHLMGLENVSGTIEVGKRADLIVIDRDLYAFPPTDINAARVQLTLVDGREVFRSTDF
jgi:predicted amidohydrolase YtcJ